MTGDACSAFSESNRMHVISNAKIRRFLEDHPDAREAAEPLDAWYRLAKKENWSKYAELKAACKSADVVGKYTVINIGGNKYRLILEVFYDTGVVLLRHVFTHHEYDTVNWSRDAYATDVQKRKKSPKTSQGVAEPPSRKGKKRRGN